MGLTAIFILGLIIALFVAFSRIGSLERQVRELSESLERMRVTRRSETVQEQPEPSEKRLPAHLKPVAPMEARPPEPELDENAPIEPEPAQVTREEPTDRHEPPPVPTQPVPPAEKSRRVAARVPDGPSFQERAAAFVRNIGPNDPNMGWETALGTYWLPRIAAVFLSVAAVLFLTLALQRFGPAARIGVGYAVTGAFFGSAFWLERKYAAYARVVYGLALALLYLVTFATYYFPPARVFDTPLITLLLLAAIISFFIGLAQYRRSPTIALVSLLLGHFTIGLASFTLDDPGLYSGAGILVLSLGGAYFLLRDRWYAIAAVGMLGSYANHFLLMMESTSEGLVAEFTLGIGVLSGYYLIYALAELFSHEEARKAMPNWFRSAFVSVNTACYFGLGTLLVAGFEFSEDSQHIFRYALAVGLFILAILYLRFRGRDPLYNAYLTKGSAALTLGLAAQFSGATLTASLAVQLVILMATARRSGLVVTRVLAFLVAGIAFLHGLYTVVDIGELDRSAAGYVPVAIQYALTVLAFLGAAQLYERTDWSARSPKKLSVSDDLRDILWQLDLVSEPSFRGKLVAKPLEGLLFPTAYAVAGTLLYMAFVYALTASGERFAAYGIAALVLVAAGRVLNSPALAAVFLLPLVSAAVSGSVEAFGNSPSYGHLLTGAMPLLALGWATEPRVVGSHRSLKPLHTAPLAFMVHAIPAWVLVLYLTQLHDPPAQLIAIAAVAVYFGGISFWVTPIAGGYVAALVLLAAHLLWYPYSTASTSSFHGVTWLLVGLAIGFDRVFTLRGLAAAGPVLVLSCIALLIRYTYVVAGDEWVPVAWVVLAVAAAGYAALTRSWAALAGAGVAGILASVQQLANAYPDPPSTTVLVAGFVATAGLWILGERIATTVGVTMDALKGLCVAAATGLMLCLLERSPALGEFYLTISWSFLGSALFGVALAFREKFYRYAGLVVILLASGRVLIIDTVNLEPMPRVLAWFVLGLVMLVLGFGYVKAFPPTRAPGGQEG